MRRDLRDTYGLIVRQATSAAPKPSSTLTTATPGMHEEIIESRAAAPPNAVP